MVWILGNGMAVANRIRVPFLFLQHQNSDENLIFGVSRRSLSVEVQLDSDSSKSFDFCSIHWLHHGEKLDNNFRSL